MLTRGRRNSWEKTKSTKRRQRRLQCVILSKREGEGHESKTYSAGQRRILGNRVERANCTRTGSRASNGSIRQSGADFRLHGARHPASRAGQDRQRQAGGAQG